MSRQSVNHDRSYWPEGKDKIIRLGEINLNMLWQQHEDEAAIFVAEALIDTPPFLSVDMFTDDIQIHVALWEVGGDMLTMKINLVDALQDEFDSLDYDNIPEQLTALRKLQAKTDELSKLLEAKSAT